ncbi:MAG: hypothetical protein GY841_01195, partial [FCB group bacterium]|nr:hypothetical protein [FCB group bacterium]
GSDWEEKDFSGAEGIILTLAHEITDQESELFSTWSEYIDSTIKQVNDIYGKKLLLFLSKERHKECTRDEIRDHLGWSPEKDKELEEKLSTLKFGDLITRGSSDFHYQGIPDDILDFIFRERYQYEIEMVKPDVRSDLAAKIAFLEDEKQSLEGKLNELKGRMLELIVCRELNKCRKENKTVADLAERMRKIPDPDHAEKVKEMIQVCSKSRFSTVWMNYYIQVPHTTSLEADVLA